MSVYLTDVHATRTTLKKISEREDQYLYVARRTFTNLFLGVVYWNLLRAVPDLTQLSLSVARWWQEFTAAFF